MKLERRIQTLRAPLDLTPLINVVLLLLLFFLLSSSFIWQPGIKIEIPKSLYGPGAQVNKLIVSVLMEPVKNDATGKQASFIFFNDEMISLPDLQRTLQKIGKEHPNQSLVLKADKQVPMGTVVDIMNVAMSSGLSVVIATQLANGSNQ